MRIPDLKSTGQGPIRCCFQVTVGSNSPFAPPPWFKRGRRRFYRRQRVQGGGREDSDGKRNSSDAHPGGGEAGGRSGKKSSRSSLEETFPQGGHRRPLDHLQHQGHYKSRRQCAHTLATLWEERGLCRAAGDVAPRRRRAEDPPSRRLPRNPEQEPEMKRPRAGAGAAKRTSEQNTAQRLPEWHHPHLKVNIFILLVFTQQTRAL
ncbi:hypothetical protein NDU88_010307 [Pleurodeles waltl]|uniref:Uncharacterized protein n=1 Tax=Pleurodeles waltl TaxID=8319 RepID=A0AAV7PXJ0_PLEWA|nr:hypothetical protein NDU88_010307 [Pleurodeles waltl]